jgi:MinD-like ATPase involved in chromosome partitioning or flagellar assembly
MLRQSLNPQVRVRYVLSKVAQQRQTIKMARIARRVLVQAFGRRAVLRTEIPHLPIFQSAINVSEPMVIHAKRSRAANITRQLARELTGIPLRRSHHFLPPIKWQRFSKAN